MHLLVKFDQGNAGPPDAVRRVGSLLVDLCGPMQRAHPLGDVVVDDRNGQVDDFTQHKQCQMVPVRAHVTAKSPLAVGIWQPAFGDVGLKSRSPLRGADRGSGGAVTELRWEVAWLYAEEAGTLPAPTNR